MNYRHLLPLDLTRPGVIGIGDRFVLAPGAQVAHRAHNAKRTGQSHPADRDKPAQSISRAIARQPQILILDDVLSAVDTQTEAAIMEKLQPVMKERTTLFISHRVSTLRYADEIIVIEDGRITQQGSHDELIAQPGYYSELNTMQKIEKEMEADS